MLSRLNIESYPDGIFRGQLTDGVKDGYGTLYNYPNNSLQQGASYQGVWKNGQKNGFGKEINGYVFYGDFEDNLKCGRGIQFKKNEEPLVGRWQSNQFQYDKQKTQIKEVESNINSHLTVALNLKNDLNNHAKQLKSFNLLFPQNIKRINFELEEYDREFQNGKGILNYKDGSKYEGELRENKSHGLGKYCFDQRTQVGQWYEDKMNGQGTLYLQNKIIYHGNWKDGKREGEGYTFNEDQGKSTTESMSYIFFGNFKDNNKIGSGIQLEISNKNQESNHKVLSGNWKDGCINGIGWSYNQKEKLIYIGEFKYSKAHGYGCLYNYEKEKLYKIYEGEWQDEREHGMGQLKIANYLYLGEFQNSVIHGYGQLYRLDQLKIQDIIVDAIKENLNINQSQSKIRDQIKKETDLLKYLGTYKNGQREGIGFMEISNNTCYEGQFKQDLFDGMGQYKILNLPLDFNGQFKGNTFEGTVTGIESGYYKGEFNLRGRNGYGEMKWQNGERYQGYWLDNQMHGQGNFYDNQGQIVSDINYINNNYQSIINNSMQSAVYKKFSGLRYQQQAIKNQDSTDECSFIEIPDEVNNNSYLKIQNYHNHPKVKPKENFFKNIQQQQQQSNNLSSTLDNKINKNEEVEDKFQHMNSIIRNSCSILQQSVRTSCINIDPIETALSHHPLYILLFIDFEQRNFDDLYKKFDDIESKNKFQFKTLDLLLPDFYKFKEKYNTIFVFVGNPGLNSEQDFQKFCSDNELEYLFIENKRIQSTHQGQKLYYSDKNDLFRKFRSNITTLYELDFIPIYHLKYLLGSNFYQNCIQVYSQNSSKQFKDFKNTDFSSLIDRIKTILQQKEQYITINYQSYQIIANSLQKIFSKDKKQQLYMVASEQLSENDTFNKTPQNKLMQQQSTMHQSQSTQSIFSNNQIQQQENNKQSFNNNFNQQDECQDQKLIVQFILKSIDIDLITILNQILKFSHREMPDLQKLSSPLVQMMQIAISKFKNKASSKQKQDQRSLFSSSHTSDTNLENDFDQQRIPEILYGSLAINKNHIRYLQGDYSQGQIIFIPQFLKTTTSIEIIQDIISESEVILEIKNNQQEISSYNLEVLPKEIHLENKFEFIYNAYSAFRIERYDPNNKILKLKFIANNTQQIKVGLQ